MNNIVEGIILKRVDYREFDSLVTIYSSEFGKKDLVVRGAKKIRSKISGHIEPFSFSEIMLVKGKQFDYVGSASALNIFQNIRKDYKKTELASKAFFALNKLLKEELADKNIFKIIYNFLNKLENNTEELDLIYFDFILKLLGFLGYTPDFQGCEYCQNELKDREKINFSFIDGRVVCPKCSKEKHRTFLISNDVVRALNKINNHNKDENIEISILNKKIIDQFLDLFIQYI